MWFCNFSANQERQTFMPAQLETGRWYVITQQPMRCSTVSWNVTCMCLYCYFLIFNRINRKHASCWLSDKYGNLHLPNISSMMLFVIYFAVLTQHVICLANMTSLVQPKSLTSVIPLHCVSSHKYVSDHLILTMKTHLLRQTNRLLEIPPVASTFWLSFIFPDFVALLCEKLGLFVWFLKLMLL